jgi:hypothetical protein
LADSIYKWSLTPSSNDASDSIINWRENQLPDTVNDSARAMMARIAEFRDDLTGALVTVGTAPAYMLTANSAFDALGNGRVLRARIHASNPAGAATLNVNGLGAKAIRKYGTGGDMAIGVGDLQLGGVYSFSYSSTANAGAGAWLVDNPSSGAGGGFASGTSMLFAMATAPVGWTKSVANDDKALRVVSGSTGGAATGTVAFSAAFAARTPTVSGVALTTAQIPSHTHTQQGSFNTGNVSADHSHTQSGGFNSGDRSAGHVHNIYLRGGDGGLSNMVGTAGRTDPYGGQNTDGENVGHSHATYISGQTGGISANHYHGFSISGQTAATGTGDTHTHASTLDMSVAYVDVIICTKD